MLSPCERYRYWLLRRWASGGLTATFCMLNPSTADGSKDDATIRRCVSYAKREGCNALVAVNLFALRATDPTELAASSDPVGPNNDNILRRDVPRDLVVVAWGAHRLAHTRMSAVVAILGQPLWCLGTTKGGAPKHPLYLPADAPLIGWP